MTRSDTSPPMSSQITNIERAGFWLLVENEELFVPFDRYPDFRHATVEEIYNFKHVDEDFHWPDLDIDIDLEALRHPERFPLIYRK